MQLLANRARMRRRDILILIMKRMVRSTVTVIQALGKSRATAISETLNSHQSSSETPTVDFLESRYTNANYRFMYYSTVCI